MAFKNKNLSVIAYANGFTMWHYTTCDAMAEICCAGYFQPVSALINAGDIMIINSGDGKTGLRKVVAGDDKKWRLEALN